MNMNISLFGITSLRRQDIRWAHYKRSQNIKATSLEAREEERFGPGGVAGGEHFSPASEPARRERSAADDKTIYFTTNILVQKCALYEGNSSQKLTDFFCTDSIKVKMGKCEIVKADASTSVCEC